MLVTNCVFVSLTHESCPVQRSAVFLIEGVDVGSFGEEEVHHLTERRVTDIRV